MEVIYFFYSFFYCWQVFDEEVIHLSEEIHDHTYAKPPVVKIESIPDGKNINTQFQRSINLWFAALQKCT